MKHKKSHSDNSDSKKKSEDVTKSESTKSKKEASTESAKSNDTKSKSEPSYLIPGSIVIAGLIIAMAVFSTGSSVATNDFPFTKLGQAAKASGASAEILACEFEPKFDESVQEDFDNANQTGGRGTPWTIVIDRETGNRYPIGGALPTENLVGLLDTNFAELASQTEGAENLALVNPVTEDDYYRGPADARYVFVEYSDFDCPFCGRFHSSMNELIQQRTDVAWVYRHFPLAQLHPGARAVANVAECAGENGSNDEAFWDFADAYFGLSS